MFLCYVDESGYNGGRFNPQQPVQTMVGIFPNVYNFHRSDTEFSEVNDLIRENYPFDELKGEQIYRGRGYWQGVSPDIRDSVIEYYLKWISDRNHKLIVTTIDNCRYFDYRNANPRDQYITNISCPYLLAGLHISMVIQKLNRREKKNKGKTILIFDEQEEYSKALTNLIFSPPKFIDEFVEFDERKEKSRLSQIVDTAFYVRSHYSSMTQVVDVVAFLFRLYLQLREYDLPEAYPGELQKITRWISLIQSKFVPFNTLYPRSNKPFVSFINMVKARGI